MKIRMTRSLRFWVDVEHERIKNQDPGRPRTELLAQILGKFEEAGDAMRFLNAIRPAIKKFHLDESTIWRRK